MPHCRYRHAAQVIDAVNDIGSPDIIAEGENLAPHVAKRMIARLEARIACPRAQLRIHRRALFQVDHRDRAVRADGIADCILCNRGNSRTLYIGNRLHASRKIQVADDR